MNDLAIVDKEKALMARRKKYTHNILARVPGMGRTTIQFADQLLELEFTPAMTTSILDVVFGNPLYDLKGKGNKNKHFVEAVTSHYGEDYLTKVSSHLGMFRKFLHDLNRIEEYRDELRAYDIDISYEHAFFLYEQANVTVSQFESAYNSLFQSQPHLRKGQLSKIVVGAIKKANENGLNLETILELDDGILSQDRKENLTEGDVDDLLKGKKLWKEK